MVGCGGPGGYVEQHIMRQNNFHPVIGHEHRSQRSQDSEDDLAVSPGKWKWARSVFLKTACT